MKAIGVPDDVVQVHGLHDLRQGWAPQGAIREIMDRVFDIPLFVNQRVSSRIVCDDGKFWWNGEWCPICGGGADALIADA